VSCERTLVCDTLRVQNDAGPAPRPATLEHRPTFASCAANGINARNRTPSGCELPLPCRRVLCPQSANCLLRWRASSQSQPSPPQANATAPRRPNPRTPRPRAHCGRVGDTVVFNGGRGRRRRASGSLPGSSSPLAPPPSRRAPRLARPQPCIRRTGQSSYSP